MNFSTVKKGILMNAIILYLCKKAAQEEHLALASDRRAGRPIAWTGRPSRAYSRAGAR